jgi:hypothetical protein
VCADRQFDATALAPSEIARVFKDIFDKVSREECAEVVQYRGYDAIRGQEFGTARDTGQRFITEKRGSTGRNVSDVHGTVRTDTFRVTIRTTFSHHLKIIGTEGIIGALVVSIGCNGPYTL